jgi:plastocyanin
MKHVLYASLFAFAFGVAAAGCGDDDDPAGAAGSPASGGAAGSGGSAGSAGSAGLAGAGGSTADASTDAAPQTVTVKVGETGDTYSPAQVTISVGDTVRWEFVGLDHTVTSGAGCTADDKFCSPADSDCANSASSAPAASYEHTFTEPGTYPYFCIPHCAQGMTGTVVVSP